MLDTSAVSAVSPFDWVKTLYLYGPLAASVFCLILVEPRARSQFRSAEIPRYVAIPVYALTWAAILVFLTVGQSIWSRMNAGEAAIRGQFELRDKNQTISSRTASFFLKRQYDPGRPGYEFRIVTPAKIREGEVIPFFLDPGTGSKDATKYELPVRAEYYDRTVEIAYHLNPGPNLFEERPGRFEVKAGNLHEWLEPLKDAVGDTNAHPHPFLLSLLRLPIVYAEANAQIDTLFRDLESPDPIIRGDARSALSAKREAALPKVEAILADSSSSYLSKLGCVIALAKMEGVDLGRLSTAAYAGVTNSANSGDANFMAWVKTLRERHPEVQAKVALDPFVGLWRLNREKSKLDDALSNLTDENRRITKAGDKTQIAIRRVYKPGTKPEETTYQLTCNGKRWKTGGQTITCTQGNLNIAEGEQTPPPRFYRREVSADGKTLIISVFNLKTRDKPISVEVFDRL